MPMPSGMTLLPSTRAISANAPGGHNLSLLPGAVLRVVVGHVRRALYTAIRCLHCHSGRFRAAFLQRPRHLCTQGHPAAAGKRGFELGPSGIGHRGDHRLCLDHHRRAGDHRARRQDHFAHSVRVGWIPVAVLVPDRACLSDPRYGSADDRGLCHLCFRCRTGLDAAGVGTLAGASFRLLVRAAVDHHAAGLRSRLHRRRG